MASIMKKGTPVRLVQPVIKGEIKEAKVIDDDIQYRVEYTGIDGEIHERFFRESELEEIQAETQGE